MVTGENAMRNEAAGLATSVDRISHLFNPYHQSPSPHHHPHHHPLHHSVPSHYGIYSPAHQSEYGPVTQPYHHATSPPSYAIYGPGAGHHDAGDSKQFGLKYSSGYEPPWSSPKYSHGHEKKSKGAGKGAALSALTLLAFLFFLNLLQNCLTEHMDAINPTVMVMTAGGRRKANLDVDSDDTSGEVIYSRGEIARTLNETRRKRRSNSTTMAPQLKSLLLRVDNSLPSFHFNEE